jgi:hypothetical protein
MEYSKYFTFFNFYLMNDRIYIKVIFMIENEIVINIIGIKLQFRLENISELVIFQEDVNANTDNLTPNKIEKITCPISLSIMSEPIITLCNHLFSKKIWKNMVTNVQSVDNK